MGFGMVHIKAEGCPIHPDDMNVWDMKAYRTLLKAYYDCYPSELEHADDYEIAVLEEN